MIVLVDADSLIWSSCYRQKEHPEDEQYHTIENARLKFDEVFMSIVNTIEEIHEVDRVLTFAGARGNFRKEISKSYKANRIGREIPPILNELQEHVKETYNSIAFSFGVIIMVLNGLSVPFLLANKTLQIHSTHRKILNTSILDVPFAISVSLHWLLARLVILCAGNLLLVVPIVCLVS